MAAQWKLSPSRLYSQYSQQQLIVTHKARCSDQIRVLKIVIIKCLKKQKYIPYFSKHSIDKGRVLVNTNVPDEVKQCQ